jgi:hypothetical protein
VHFHLVDVKHFHPGGQDFNISNLESMYWNISFENHCNELGGIEQRFMRSVGNDFKKETPLQLQRGVVGVESYESEKS